MTFNEILISFLQGNCCYTDDCNKNTILNATAAGHMMYQAPLFVTVLSGFIAKMLMGKLDI